MWLIRAAVAMRYAPQKLSKLYHSFGFAEHSLGPAGDGSRDIVATFIFSMFAMEKTLGWVGGPGY